MKKKLLILNDVSPEDDIGGQATFLRNIIPYLDKHFNVQILSLPGKYLKVKWIPRRFLYFVYVLSKFHIVHSADIVFSNTPEAAFVGCFINAKRLFHIFHGNTNPLTRSKFWYGKYFKWVYRLFDMIILKRAQLCYTVGETRERTKFLYQPIDIEYVENIAPHSAVRSDFLFVGRLEEVKQVDKIIRAFKLYINKFGTTDRLIICGMGSLEASLKKVVQTEELGNWVDFRGRTTYEEVISLMKSAKVLVMASSFEGFPMVIAEALCCGLPVVTTSVGAIDKIIIHNENGILLPPNFSDTEYAQSIFEVSSNLEEFSKKAIIASKVFNAQTLVNNILLKDFDLN